MRFFRLIAVVMALTVCGALTAQASISAQGVTITVDGQSLTIPAVDGAIQVTGMDILGDDGALLAEIGNLSANFETDPFITYGIAVTNFLPGTLGFSFNFINVYIGGPYTSLSSSHSSSVTDGGANPDGSIVVTPTLVDIHNPGVDGSAVPGGALGTGCNLTGAPGFSQTCNADPGVSTPVSTGVTGPFNVDVEFKLSGDDIYTANGRVQLNNAVPEPAPFWLLGFGLTALAVIRRRSQA